MIYYRSVVLQVKKTAQLAKFRKLSPYRELCEVPSSAVPYEPQLTGVAAC